MIVRDGFVRRELRSRVAPAPPIWPFQRVLVRAVGPGLATFGVGGALTDPRLDLMSGSSIVSGNDNWETGTAAVFSSVGAFGLTSGSRDAALVAALQPGSYTVHVSGVNNATGVALVEVYELPAAPGN